MTMENMVKAFEKEGFTVNEKYNSAKQAYEFNIEKDGLGYHTEFAYPNSAPFAVVDKAQRNFIDQSIRNFNDAFAAYMIDGRDYQEEWDPYKRTFVTIGRQQGKTDVLDALAYAMKPLTKLGPLPDITNVKFNDPATIVFWSDGTKTVVKTQDDEPFDPEKGLAMAMVKKFLGNKGSYFNEISKWVDKYEEEKKKKEQETEPIGTVIAKNVTDSSVTFTAKISDPDKIRGLLGLENMKNVTFKFDTMEVKEKADEPFIGRDGVHYF